MKKIVLLLVSISMLLVSCSSTPEATVQQVQEQEQVEQAFEEVYQHFEQVLILDGAQEYKVRSRDTLSKIANKFYGQGNGYYFPLIMLASSDTVLDPDTIVPGMVLTVPDLQKNLNDTSVQQTLKTFFTEIADVYKNKKTEAAPTIRKELLKIAESL
ncbi:MAG: LysM peptidoglycan-binding domain-containing protein [Spirochaetaceae bacterium]|nr:LysM peptidoglycan-binding domain-containing protein [Spirochaetaceae bacterium]